MKRKHKIITSVILATATISATTLSIYAFSSKNTTNKADNLNTLNTHTLQLNSNPSKGSFECNCLLNPGAHYNTQHSRIQVQIVQKLWSKYINGQDLSASEKETLDSLTKANLQYLLKIK
ncbi:hypothetical protein V2E24_02685 [Mycoplasmopsis ciconiae]|uniref:Uncharacterized protein n=1 Tax=Mycoplasmopsis ciconiae TaxID=561067 RepID=A0ABU7MLQ9_9BACT|nr:hypothetical protein [Mycoplasmopsis ciconiae]